MNDRIITVLDASTLGADLDLTPLAAAGQLVVWDTTAPDKVAERLADTEVVILNKVKLGAQNLPAAKKLKLICVAATGYDNIDLDYCRRAGIAVCNVKGYSTQSVAQLTLAMVLSLACHLPAYCRSVADGSYSREGKANRLTPVYHELAGQTWGILGFGNIGRQVARVAEAMGCRVLVCKRTPVEGYNCVDVDRLCRESDILSIHTPLNNETRGILSRARIATLKPHAIVVNVARGAVTDEAALADAIREERIGGLGVDVYATEPIPADHPFASIAGSDRVCMTPHMAWGAYEARVRVRDEMLENIRAFDRGELRCRVDVL